MASIHAVLRKKKNKQGLFPIAIRVTKDRKSIFIHTGQYLDEKYWDIHKERVKKNHANSVRLNNVIASELAQVNSVVLDMIAKHTNDFHVTDIKPLLTNTTYGNSFFDFAEDYIRQLERSKKYSRVDSERPLLNRIKRFSNGKNLDFDQITTSFLRKLIVHLKRQNTISERSIANILMFIRNLYNKAIEQNLAKQENYPFGSGKGKVRISIPESIKIGLTLQEIERIEKLDLSNSKSQNHARSVWLFSFYLAGMRVADVLKIKWSDINDGRLYYRMDKNSKTLSLKITPKLQSILDTYEPLKTDIHDYIFPELRGVAKNDGKEFLRRTKNATYKFNKQLRKIAQKAEIDKKLTMHIARHSFGNISGDKIPIQMLQKLYRHSNITTTINYQANFITQDVDDALEKVLGSS